MRMTNRIRRSESEEIQVESCSVAPGARKSKEEPDTIAAPTEFTPDGIPKTSAASIIIVDANSGRILYEKNPYQVRQAASTQKLLTARLWRRRVFSIGQ